MLLIIFNDYFKRPSRTLIKQTKEYIKESGEFVTTIYINNHNHKLWTMVDDENRQEFKEYIDEKNKK